MKLQYSSSTPRENQLIDRFGREVNYIRLLVTDRCDLRCVYCMTEKMTFVPRTQLLTLEADRFHDMTRVGELHKTLEGIEAAIACNFDQIKLNAVVLKNHNYDEVLDLVNFCIERGIDISFIEEMPLGENAHHDRASTYCSSDELLSDLEQHFELMPTTMKTAGQTRYYRIREHENTRIGFISPHSHNFYDTCNRVRLTAEGRLLLCLGQEHSIDLRHAVRSNPSDKAALDQAIIDSMEIKPKGHDFNLNSQTVLFRHMNMTGG